MVPQISAFLCGRVTYVQGPRVVAGRYELLARIGRGGSSTVWLARDRVDDTAVALKWIRRGDPSAARQARAEVATLRMLQVPGVVALRDEGAARGRTFVVMERVEGAPFPGRARPCGWRELEGPLLSLLEALGRVHALGVVHRDLKPANVLVREGRAVLVDFGIARLDASWQSPWEGGESTYGTVAYMAPEAWDGNDDPRSDLYAVGVMAYRTLTGRFPFPVRGEVALLLGRRAEPRRLRWGAADAPAPVLAVLESLLAPLPDARPGSAAEVVARLRATSPEAPGCGRRLPERSRWSEEALRELFAGPDRLLHLREDAARLLYARSGGAPARVVAELERWEREGAARWSGERYVVQRIDLDRREASAAAASDGGSLAAAGAVTGDAADLMQWLALAGTALRPAALRQVTGWSAGRVGRALRELGERGHVLRDRGGASARDGAFGSIRWAPARKREAHERLAAALRPRHPARLQHLLMAGSDAREIAAEVRHTAEGFAARGRLSQAEHVLREGVRALRGCSDCDDALLLSMFGLWARVAIEQWTPRALDRLRCELSAPEYRRGPLAAVERLMRAAHATLHWTPQAEALVARVPRCEDAGLELLRMEVAVNAARRVSKGSLRRVLATLHPVAGAAPEWLRRRASWEARLAVAEERYEDAARCYGRGARGEAWVSRRHRECLGAAAAWMEASRFERARGLIERVHAEAVRLRLPVTEGRAVWLRRTLEWRLGHDAEPDPEWVDAALEVDPVVARLMACHEAILAWHQRDAAAFQGLYARASAIEGATTEPRTWSVVEAMAVDLGLRALDRDGREALIARVADHVPAIALQVAALTWPGGPPDAREAERALRFAGAVPRGRWAWRVDVLSVDACLARLGVAAP